MITVIIILVLMWLLVYTKKLWLSIAAIFGVMLCIPVLFIPVEGYNEPGVASSVELAELKEKQGYVKELSQTYLYATINEEGEYNEYENSEDNGVIFPCDVSTARLKEIVSIPKKESLIFGRKSIASEYFIYLKVIVNNKLERDALCISL